MIFNRNSTLQHFVQILSGNVNSSVRARAKTYGSTPVSIELPRGRHLGLNACISLTPAPASFGLQCPHLHCTRVHNKRPQTPTSPCARAQLKTRASKKMRGSATSHARLPPCVLPKDARVGHVIRP